MNKLFWLIVAGALAMSLLKNSPGEMPGAPAAPGAGDDLLAQAFEQRRSDLQLGGVGVVLKNLPDDNSGSRHQKFILRLQSGQTLLISHNIDLAPRIDALREGDGVAFYGEYEWTSRGGVIHWTHHDPAGRHEDGWLKHNDIIYQ